MDIRSFLGAFQNGFQPSNQFVLQVVLNPELRDRIQGGTAATPGIPDVSPLPDYPRLPGNFGTHVTRYDSVARFAFEWIERGLLCERTQLPDRAFDQVPMTQYGVTENYPFKTDYTALDATFLLPLMNDGRNPVLDLFSGWQNAIQDVRNGVDSTRDFTWPNNYRTDIYITAFDRQGQPSIQYHFEKAYPKTVEQIPVTWSDQSEMSRLSVEFTYTCWRLVHNNSPLPIPTEALGPFGVFGIGIPTPIGTVRI